MSRESLEKEYEKLRLQALERYQILDTEAEKAFDDMAELAAKLCRVPMALVSFIDNTRQWYKAKVGCSIHEVPIESTFCQFAIAQPGEVLAVSDATHDHRFQNNPSVVGDPGVRYYLGAPIVTNDGYAIGTVCAIDFKPRDIDPSDLSALAALSRLVLDQLELRLHIMSLEEHAEKQREVQHALEEATKAKSFFLANVSHEIRTPLTSIIGFSELLRHNQELGAQELDNAIQSINRNSSHLLQLVNDILDFSKIEAEQMRPDLSDFPLNSLVADIESFVGTRAIEKGISFDISVAKDVPIALFSDLTRLKQILFNLIGNAIKFTEAGSVKLIIERAADGGMLFSVSDTGIGISEGSLPKLFQPFSQAEESTARRYGGTGLGLAISKKLVNLLSGSLEIKTLSGQGSCFRVSIPKEFCREGHLKAGHSALPAGQEMIEKRKVKVLIAEDFLDNRLFFNLIFKKVGVEPHFAENGAEAIDKAQQEDFDIIFMDIQMPVVDGISATRELVRRGYPKPIIALTAASQENIAHKLLQEGFSGYLGKPFKKDDLARIISQFSKR